ncbi:class E sortase [Streptomyces sp. NRRL F-5630]|uniref:class E sortase n=1 Tax=unclassified Streptomyces TaxID=2593676 RepID=UPI0004C64D2F
MTALRPEHETGREPRAPLTDTPVMGTPVMGTPVMGTPVVPAPAAAPSPESPQAPASEVSRAPASGAPQAGAPEGRETPGPDDDSTMALRLPASLLDARGAVPARPPASGSPAPGSPVSVPPVPGPPPGEGRAARRRAAAKGARGTGSAGASRTGQGRRRAGGHRRTAPGAPAPAPASAVGSPPQDGRPLSRVEARRAERARRPSAGTRVSAALGEGFITLGLVMLLFVAYQLWWTNVRAHREANGAAHQLQDDWADGKRSPGAFQPGEGFAILTIPKLDVVVPIAEGVSKAKVLDKGMVGHYGQGALKTAMPAAKSGNFALAGHRNTHGEPFRYLNRLKPGDPIVVETRDTYFVYRMTSILPQTSPANTAVLHPVPAGSGFTKPGRYLTLTTCTPEFTSTYRMIVWGKMVEERPRGEGKPDALL